MKKIFSICLALVMSLGIMNAQVATENAKFLDNTYVSVNAGVATPLDFNSVFPVNPTVGVAVGKWFTPVWGAEVEGTAWLGSNHFNDSKNFIRGHYVGLNGLVNVSNLVWGYKGAPRFVELGAVLGAGWIHQYRSNVKDGDMNSLGLKTGLDIAFNFTADKAHTLSVRPAVLWDMYTAGTMPLQFDKRNAQLQLAVAYTYHFKTSNGTRYFKTYDVGQMNADINALRADNDKLRIALAAKPKEVIVEKVVTKEVPVVVKDPVTVFFNFNDATLDARAKETLNTIGQNGVYVVDGYASSEGSTDYNLKLSQRRADAVKEYLEGRGAKVESATGHGVQFGTTTGRVVVVSVK